MRAAQRAQGRERRRALARRFVLAVREAASRSSETWKSLARITGSIACLSTAASELRVPGAPWATSCAGACRCNTRRQSLSRDDFTDEDRSMGEALRYRSAGAPQYGDAADVWLRLARAGGLSQALAGDAARARA